MTVYAFPIDAPARLAKFVVVDAENVQDARSDAVDAIVAEFGRVARVKGGAIKLKKVPAETFKMRAHWAKMATVLA